MAFHEVSFPQGISYGARGGPGFNTAIIEKDSGQEERVQRWAGARHSYDISRGVRSVADAAQVIDFHFGRSGAAHGFRFKDWSDYATTVDHTLFNAGVTAMDETLGVGDGTTTQFQLLTSYQSGSQLVSRKITKPVAGSVRVGVNGADTNGAGWTVNTTTGIVTWTVAPVLGASLTAGFEFDVPVRFGDAVDKQLPFSIDGFDASSVPSIVLVELMDEAAIDEDFWYGGGTAFGALSANATVTVGNGRALTFNPQSGGLKVFLPNPAALSAGGPYFFLTNQAAATTMLIRTHLDAAVATLAAGATLIAFLTIDAGLNKAWLCA